MNYTQGEFDDHLLHKIINEGKCMVIKKTPLLHCRHPLPTITGCGLIIKVLTSDCKISACFDPLTRCIMVNSNKLCSEHESLDASITAATQAISCWRSGRCSDWLTSVSARHSTMTCSRKCALRVLCTLSMEIVVCDACSSMSTAEPITANLTYVPTTINNRVPTTWPSRSTCHNYTNTRLKITTTLLVQVHQ